MQTLGTDEVKIKACREKRIRRKECRKMRKERTGLRGPDDRAIEAYLYLATAISY